MFIIYIPVIEYFSFRRFLIKVLKTPQKPPKARKHRNLKTYLRFIGNPEFKKVLYIRASGIQLKCRCQKSPVFGVFARNKSQFFCRKKINNDLIVSKSL